jgi:hypothetical protein
MYENMKNMKNEGNVTIDYKIGQRMIESKKNNVAIGNHPKS